MYNFAGCCVGPVLFNKEAKIVFFEDFLSFLFFLTEFPNGHRVTNLLSSANGFLNYDAIQLDFFMIS